MKDTLQTNQQFFCSYSVDGLVKLRVGCCYCETNLWP